MVRPNRRPSFTLIYCYRNAVGISRKVDPDVPFRSRQQRIEADERPGLRSATPATSLFPVREKSISTIGATSRRRRAEPNPDGSDARIMVIGNSETDPDPADRNPDIGQDAGPGAREYEPLRRQHLGAGSTAGVDEHQSQRRTRPPMVLTQIHFNNGMRGRFGAARRTTKQSSRWSEFYGNVETFRAKVPERER